ATYPATHYLREINLPSGQAAITGNPAQVIFNTATDVINGVNFGNNLPNFPSADLVAVGPVTQDSGFNPFQFSVTFTGQANPGGFVNANSIRSVGNKVNAIVLNGPNGFTNKSAHWISDDSGGVNKQVITAVYQLDQIPDNGNPGWNNGDNGNYVVAIS